MVELPTAFASYLRNFDHIERKDQAARVTGETTVKSLSWRASAQESEMVWLRLLGNILLKLALPEVFSGSYALNRHHSVEY